MIRISEKIKAHRLKKGITQRELAATLGVSIQAVSKWETARSLPDVTLLVSLARELGISLDELLGDESYVEYNERFLRSHPLGARVTLPIAEEALRVFPNDFTWLYRRACDEFFIGADAGGDERELYLSRARGHFEALMHDFPDKDVCKSMYEQVLSALGEDEGKE